MIEKKNCEEIAKLSYLAGIIDGEGAIMITRKNREKTGYGLLVEVANTEIRVMTWLRDNFGGKIRKGSFRGGKKRDVYYWDVRGRDGFKILKRVEEFLVIKKERAEIAMHFWNETRRWGGCEVGKATPLWKLKRQEKYYQQMRKLNKRGKRGTGECVDDGINGALRAPLNQSLLYYFER